MKRIFTLFIFFVCVHFRISAQQKNFAKINVRDCANCTNVLSQLLKKDPKITFVIHDEYVQDSIDVIEKFNLKAFQKQIIWSGKLYDSFDKQTESEFIQFCDKKEINRSGLRAFKYFYKGCEENTICLTDLSNFLVFKDYKNFLLITNYISNKQYVYYKKYNTQKLISIDSGFVRSIYVDYLKKPSLYEFYKHESAQTPSISPKVRFLFPFDDSTLIGSLVLYDTEITPTKDTELSAKTNIIKINYKNKNEVLFLPNKLPTSYRYFNTHVFSYKSKFYLPLALDMDKILENNSDFSNLAIVKKEKNLCKFEKYLPTTLNQYLIDNKIYQNLNTHFLDNGYYLMSLSNYIINLNTEEKIYLPIDDSVFKNLMIYPNFRGISYNVSDFKYNETEGKFFILYNQGRNYYVASFKPNSKSFETNDFLFSFDNLFLNSSKNSCLSWDGKSILYAMKGDNCFKYATVAEIQELAKNYKKAD
jgi:hypothetical protein